jgi:hypothetical protein
LEDQRERNKAVSLNVLQFQNLFDECWCLSKKLRVHYIFEKLEDTFEKIEFTKTLEIKVLFWWNIDSVQFLTGEYSLVPDNMTVQFDDIEKRLKSYEGLTILDIYPTERNISSIAPNSKEIFEIYDQVEDLDKYSTKQELISTDDFKTDLIIQSESSFDSKIEKNLNKKETVVMTDNEVFEKYAFMCSLGFEVPLSWRVKTIEVSQVSH